MKRCFVPVILAVLLLGCGESSTDEGPSATPDPAAPATQAVAMTGKQAYDRVCASCHDEGVDGAPRTGDRDAWADRSQLWEAVLFEHAKDGFLGMPAMGGEETLDDTVVEKAAEYMLKQTFPDRISD